MFLSLDHPFACKREERERDKKRKKERREREREKERDRERKRWIEEEKIRGENLDCGGSKGIDKGEKFALRKTNIEISNSTEIKKTYFVHLLI